MFKWICKRFILDVGAYKLNSYINHVLPFSVEIGKNMAEVNRLRELQANQTQAKQDAMRNSDDGLHEVNAQLDLNN